MKLTVQFEVADEVILKAIANPDNINPVMQALSSQVQISLREEFGKTLIQMCNQYKIPLGDLVKSDAARK